MARIRTIKPDFFFHEGMANLSVTTRLFFIGLWTQVDREGRCEDGAKRLRAQIFPYSPEIDAEEILLELAAWGHIYRYKSDGKSYIEVHNFLKHQRPHIREVPSEIPAPSPSDKKKKHNLGSAKASPRLSGPDKVVKPYPLDKGEGKGREGNGVIAVPSEPKIVKPKTPTQRIVEAYKMAKDVDRNDKAWDKANFGRYSKAAVNLLACFGQDVEKCAAYIFLRAEDLNEKRLDWTLETITRHAFDGIGIPKKEDDHGPTLEPLESNRLPEPRGTRFVASSRSLAGDALRAIELSAVRPDGVGDLDGPEPNQNRDDEDFS